jgi:hypothetical protein
VAIRNTEGAYCGLFPAARLGPHLHDEERNTERRGAETHTAPQGHTARTALAVYVTTRRCGREPDWRQNHKTGRNQGGCGCMCVYLYAEVCSQERNGL